MHKNIELALDGCAYDNNLMESQVFLQFVREWLEPRLWKVYRLEWSIYSEDAMVAGQIDALFERGGLFHMIDWKRSSKVLQPDEGARFKRVGMKPLDSLYDSACNHYFMQQNPRCTLT